SESSSYQDYSPAQITGPNSDGEGSRSTAPGMGQSKSSRRRRRKRKNKLASSAGAPEAAASNGQFAGDIQANGQNFAAPAPQQSFQQQPGQNQNGGKRWKKGKFRERQRGPDNIGNQASGYSNGNGAEMLILSVWFDNDALIARGGLCAIVGHWAAWAVRGSVGFAVLFATFAWLKVRAEILSLSSAAERAAPSLAFAGVHALWIAAFVDISRVLYSSHATWIPAGVLLLLWLFAGLAALACAALAVLPMRLWSQLLRATGSLWAVTLALVVAACIAGNYVRLLWEPTAGLTFVLSKAVLTPFVSSVIADPATRILGTPNFDVQIAPECSGLEGVG